MVVMVANDTIDPDGGNDDDNDDDIDNINGDSF